MKRIMKIITSLLVLMIFPAWLYASGNLPPLFAGEGRIIRTVHSSCPIASRTTFIYTQQALEKMRDFGIKVPQTYNERVLNLKRMRNEAIKECNSIIANR